MRRVAVLILVLFVSACAATSRGKALVISGESLKAVGEEFVQVGAAFKTGCDVTKTIKQPDCQRFRVFGEQFQKSYPVAVKGWEIARAASDTAAQEESSKVIAQLAADMSSFAVLVMQVYGGK